MKLILTLLLLLCVEFGSLSKDEFELNPLIIGGSTAEIGEFPFVVASIFYHFNGDLFNCGGSIIGPRWIFTAGHCAYFYIDHKVGKLSGYVLTGTNNRTHGGVVHNISRAFLHPHFDRLNGANDIGLLELAQPIAYNNITQPIQIAQKSPPENTTVSFAGWGYIDLHQTQPTMLQKINLNTMNVQKCGELIRIHENEHPLCALVPVGKGLCRNDSGGPLIYNKTVVGVYSRGVNPCNNGYPNVFSNPVFYHNWIQSITGNL